MFVQMRSRPSRRPRASDGACEVDFIDEGAVAAVRTRLPDADAIQAAADRFHLLSDPTRVRIILALSVRELCVCDLACLVERSTGAVSHALAALRNAGLVRFRVDGKLAYYSIADEEMARLLARTFARMRDAA